MGSDSEISESCPPPSSLTVKWVHRAWEQGGMDVFSLKSVKLISVSNRAGLLAFL